MKIKTDFVTNSSSTSFLIIIQDEFNKEPFMRLMGVDEESELYSLVDNLYYSIKENLSDIRDSYSSSYWGEKYSTFEDFVISEFSSEILQKVISAESDNKKVLVGSFSNDQEPILGFVCCDCFIEENESIYFNYTNSSW